MSAMTSYLKPVLLGIFCLTSLLAFSQSDYRINYQSGKVSIYPLPPIIASANSSKIARWGIAWTETGDGHYHLETVDKKKKPTPRSHVYSQIKDYKARVYLTPFYSLNDPFFFSQTIKKNKIQRGSTQKTYNVIPTGKRTGIDVNTQDRMVPGHEIRTALHYKAQTGTEGGWLFFFYNKPDELSADFDHFDDPEDLTFYYDEKDVSSQYASVTDRLTVDARTAVEELFEDSYDGLMIFESSRMTAREERRLFFTIQSNDDLQQFQNEKRKLSFTTVWVPWKGAFDKSKNIATKQLELLAIHDPNYVKINPSPAYFHKKKPNSVETAVYFQNTGDEGTVKKATIHVPVDESLDMHSVRLTGATHDAKTGNSVDGLTAPFVEIDSIVLNEKNKPDTLVFRFHNVDLYSKKSCGLFKKGKSKGFLKFELTGSGKRTSNAKSMASIRFGEIAELIETKTRSARWRQKSLYFRAGYNFGHSGGNWDFLDDDIIDRIGVGMGFLNARIGMGFNWGGEVNVNTFKMGRETNFAEVFDIETGEPVPPFQYQNEILKLRLLEVQGRAGYQIGNFVTAYIGAGLAIPIFSELEVAGELVNADGFTYAEDSDLVNFGLFTANEEAVIFNTPIEPKPKLGVTSKWGLEFGDVHNFVFGIVNEQHFCGKYYNDTSIKLNNWQVYLRFKLSTLAGGKRR